MKIEKRKILYLMIAVSAFITFIYGFRAFSVESSYKNIVINEVCTDNLSCLYDENGEHPDWAELYNKSSSDIDISGWYLSDNAEKWNRWSFPNGTVIPGHGYLTVFMDGSKPGSPDENSNFSLMNLIMTGKAIPENDTGLHASFKLSDNETLYLTSRNHNNVDHVSLVPMKYDSCYARVSDGENELIRMTPTPCSSNENGEEVIYPTLSKPVFSKDNGFYADPFDLELYAEKGDIYYTLDGSDPTVSSNRYVSPIPIYDRSDEDNVYSVIRECSIALLPYVKRFRGSNIPDWPIPKCNVIRAVAIDEAGNTSEIETRVFFPLSSDTEYKGIGIISLVTDPDNLFDYEKGIYIIGKCGVDDFHRKLAASENALKFLKENPDTPTDGTVIIENVDMDEFIDCNYRQRGSAWEREAVITVFDNEHHFDFSQNCGIRVRGNRSCNFPKKSLNLYARSMYGDNTFNTSFFDEEYSRLTLFSGGQDKFTISKDKIIEDLTEDLDFISLDFTSPYALFIDGELWGIYRISEKLDCDMIGWHFDVDPEEVIIVKSDLLSKGLPSDGSLYGDFMQFIKNADFTKEDDYLKLQEMADLDSIIDYYAARFYVDKGMDWPNVNTGFWRTRNIDKNNPYADGRWRCVNFDNNSNLDYENVSANTIRKTMYGTKSYSPDKLFSKLIENDEFKSRFLERMKYISKSVFDPDKAIKLLDEYTEELRPYIELEYDRYYEGFFDTSTFDKEIEDIRKYFMERADYIIPYAEEICR